MTRKEALAEAKKRWGLLGGIHDSDNGAPDTTRNAPNRYRCGVRKGLGGKLIVQGQGRTWAEAFANVPQPEPEGTP